MREPTVWDHRKAALDMTPAAKLARLAALLQSERLPPEVAAILATVGAVPAGLRGVTDPAAWAAAAARDLPHIRPDEATYFEWFGAFGLGVRDEAHRAGHQQGLNEAFTGGPGKELVDTLVLIRNGLAAEQIKAPTVRDQAKGGPAQPLIHLVVEALAGVGITEGNQP